MKWTDEECVEKEYEQEDERLRWATCGRNEVREGKMVWRAPERSCKLPAESRERLAARRWQNAKARIDGPARDLQGTPSADSPFSRGVTSPHSGPEWFRQDRASREAARRCRVDQLTVHVTLCRSIGAADSENSGGRFFARILGREKVACIVELPGTTEIPPALSPQTNPSFSQAVFVCPYLQDAGASSSYECVPPRSGAPTAH
jgi:hypothetical protein